MSEVKFLVLMEILTFNFIGVLLIFYELMSGQDLEAFGERVMSLAKELENSDVYNRDCNISDAWVIIDGFSKRLTVLENEAQDLIELQGLLEASVVNFEILPQYVFY